MLHNARRSQATQTNPFFNRQDPLAWIVGAVLLALLLVCTPHPARAQTPTRTPTPPPGTPPGFYLLDSAWGVQLFRKDYPEGKPDFVQVIDLSQGARLELMHGQLMELREKKGVYGGADPSMTSLPIENYWKIVQQNEKDAFCTTNGQFFYMPEYPTRLAFPLKVDGVVVTDGWGIDTYVDQKLILHLWEDHADIVDLNQETLYGSDAPDAIGGLTEEANKRAKFSVGRTFFGLDDRDRDGAFETILIFNTLSAKQTGAADTLRSFGADRVMMLDGGGSTQLICRSGWHIRSDRPLPQAIGIVAGVQPPVSSQVEVHSDWPIILEGDRLPLEVEITNTGVVSWTPETTQFVVQTERLEFEERVALQETVQPGKSTRFQANLDLANQTGVVSVTIRLGVDYEGKIYKVKPFRMRAIVLPFRLSQQKNELDTALKQWAAERPQEVETLASEWIDAEMDRPVAKIQLEGVQQVRSSDLALVPLLMLPGLALIAWAIARTRQ